MISNDFINKYGAQKVANEDALGFVSQTDDFVASTVVDVGTSLFNSVVSLPKLFGINTDEYKVETYDVLKNVNEDWAGYYQENKDLVETASFIAGALLPAGLAFKGMKALQAGKLGFYPVALSDATQTKRITELTKLLELGKKSTSDFRNLRWKILSANAGQETLQAAGAELAVLATMNDHAWMEDYLKDPVQNFGISMLIGGVLGTGVGQLTTRKMLRDKLGTVASEATDKVLSKLIDIPLGITDVDKVQRFNINSKILRDIAIDESNNPLTRQIADDFATRWEGMAGKLEQNTIFGPTLKATKDTDVLQQVREIMLSDAAFGANRVDFLTYDPKEFTKVGGTSGSILKAADKYKVQETFKDTDPLNEGLWASGRAIQQSLLVTDGLKNLKPEWKKLMQDTFTTHYSPFHKAWIPADEVHKYARAVDMGKTTWERVNVFRPNPDAFAEFAVRNVPTATADKYWIDRLGSVANAPIEPSIYIMKGDLGTQNAWFSRLAELQAEGKPLPKIHLVPESAGAGTVSEMRKKATQITLEDLEDNLERGKQYQIRPMLEAGASLQEISIRLNIPMRTLEHHLMTGTEYLRKSGDWRSYTNAGSIESEYMSQKTRMLSFTTNGHRLASLAFRNADASAQLDAAKIKQMNRELMANVVASSKSDIAKQFYQVLNRDDKIWDLFESQLGNVVNEKSGSFFFSSADFAARDMGDIGRIATIKGQEFFGIANNASEQLLTNLSSKVRAATTTQVGINEFNRVVNLLQATAGYRDIDPATGLLYRLVEQEPGVFVKEALKNADGTHLDLSPQMRDFLIEMRNVSRELWHMKNTINRIQGFKDLNDIGLWVPAFNPINKFISYVIDQQAENGQRVKLLVGRTPEQLADLERNWVTKNGTNSRYKLITKAQQEDYNFWQMRTDPTEMDFADISKFHSGASASALPVVDDSFASTIIENLHNRVVFYGRKMQEMYLDDIMSTLDQMSAVNQKYFSNQPTLVRAIGLAQREDAAKSIKNVLLGNPNLNQYSTWQGANNNFAAAIEWGSRKIQEFYRGMFEFDEGKRVLKKGEYVKYAKELETYGIRNPFKDFNDYLSANAKAAEGRQFTIEEIIPKNLDLQEPTEHHFKILKNGKQIGTLSTNYEAANQNIFIDFVGARDAGGPGAIGVAGLRELGEQLKSKFPEAKTIMGERISGVRATGVAGDKNEIDIFGGPLVQTKIPGYSIGTRTADTLEKLRVDEVSRKHNVPFASAERIVAAGNSVLATMALRVMEAGHALVTAVSWPIIMAPQFYQQMPKTFLGTALGEGIEAAYPARAIYDGIRWRHSDAAKPVIDRWINEGFGASIVSEATKLNQLIHSGGKGAMDQINKILESDLVKKLSKPSDFAESETRLWALSIGYQMSRRLYPGISDAGADMFAKEFMTRSIGNYYSAQRPAMFQGTLGVAIGLFQTYMLTWAQSAFRSIEEKSFKALAAQMLTQAGMFGTSSLPLYDTFSKTIGEHFSDKHYDLQTGTYRALPDPLAEFVVYGLASSLGVGLYTRGDMQPRIPFVQDNPLDTIAAVNATRQIVGSGAHTIKKVLEANGMGDRFRGFLEGIAMQSLSRPMARIVEAIPLPDGQGGWRAVGSISREGNTITTSDEIYSAPGLLSRLVASRSTEEQVKREVDYLNSFYGSVDFRNRKSATEALKSSIRSGNLTQETLEKTAQEYLRTGTATGWKAALNEALATSEGGIDYKLGKRLRPDSPLIKMIDDNY